MSHFIFCYGECYYTECFYAECRYTECSGALYQPKLSSLKTSTYKERLYIIWQNKKQSSWSSFLLSHLIRLYCQCALLILWHHSENSQLFFLHVISSNYFIYILAQFCFNLLFIPFDVMQHQVNHSCINSVSCIWINQYWSWQHSYNGQWAAFVDT